MKQEYSAKGLILEMVDGFMEIAKFNLEKDKQLLPIAGLISKRRATTIGIDPNMMETESSKNKLEAYLKGKAKQLKADASLLLSECWIGRDPSTPPSQLPERREAITISYSWRDTDGTIKGGILIQFFHHEGEKIVFGETNRHEGLIEGNKMGGRFASLLE